MSWILSLVFISGIARAEDPATCPYFVERQEGTQIQQLWSEGSKSCFFSVTPLNAYVDLIYRDHLFTSEGLFMVFNSFGEGSDSETTAAREFYMFPRTEQKFEHRWDVDKKELEITHVTGDKFVFDARKARLKSMTRAQVSVANDVEVGNRGGIEISNYQGILLDGGFSRGSSPTADPDAKAMITDKQGAKCSVYNRQIFDYTSDGDVIFKFTDPEFYKFLKKNCPKLNP